MKPGRVALLLAPTVLASLLLAAHFLRFFVVPLVLGSAALPLLLLVRRTWAVRVVQVALVLGAMLWALTTNQLVHDRLLMGQPFVRLSAILGGVSLFTLLAALLLEAPTLKQALRRRS